MKEEIFLPIMEYEGIYEISNYGNVRSLTRKVTANTGYDGKRTVRERILKPSKAPNGYLGVILVTADKGRYTGKIHRLVALHFIPNPNSLPEVNHKDGNKQNNYFENLEWSDRLGNYTHAVNVGLMPKLSKDEKGRFLPNG